MNDHEMGGKKPGKAPPKSIEELLGGGHEVEQASGESKKTTESPTSNSKAGVMAGIVNAMNNGAVQALMKTPPSQWNDQQRLLAARYTAAANGGAAGPTTVGGFDDFSMADVANVAAPGAHRQTREASADSLQQGGGQLIPQSILQAVEASTGVSVSDARYRTDQSDAVTELGAEAATVGSTIHFAEGKFDPSSSEGQRLIAEEVLHVAQGRLGLLPQTGGISSTDMTAEVEAKAASRELTRGLGIGSNDAVSTGQQTQLAHVTQELTNDIASDPFGGGFDSMFDSMVGASSAESMQSMAGMDASVSPVVDQSMPQGLAPEGGVEAGGESAAPVMLSEIVPDDGPQEEHDAKEESSNGVCADMSWGSRFLPGTSEHRWAEKLCPEQMRSPKDMECSIELPDPYGQSELQDYDLYPVCYEDEREDCSGVNWDSPYKSGTVEHLMARHACWDTMVHPASLLLKKKETEEAVEEEQTEEVNPEREAALRVLGEDLHEALETMEWASKLTPEEIADLTPEEIADGTKARKKLDTLRAFERALELDPSGESRDLQGRRAVLLKKKETAEQDAAKKRREFPDLESPTTLYDELFGENQSVAELVEEYRKAQERWRKGRENGAPESGE